MHSIVLRTAVDPVSACGFFTANSRADVGKNVLRLSIWRHVSSTCAATCPRSWQGR